ncbi:dihydrolipoyl dehydrogenase [Oligosphaera ethanolica]|uniref:Dihydrolipoyl dehydrogenase n=1 Tax=Oligosphaera ethanolica TaxID=760260 RepID=A0AAE3VH80_9BACT|nr:dihydrolipoyl dehydrogenase [Oligosphaera ethanolica]MDQ0290211.1 dihydrolipoamide dehydrogenase [Oligosphaera ethanolica]
MYDLIVIGAGPGGYEAAAYAAKLGKKVALFEKNELGGTCLNVGCIPTKTLLRSAKALEDCHEAKLYGVHTAEATIDMAAVQARKKSVVDILIKGVAGMLKRAGVDVIKAEAKITAPGKVSADGKTYEAANILVATGSVPAAPPIPGLRDNPLVLDSTGILDLNAVPDSLVVIGGGVIGLEFASFFATVGSKVTVVEMLPKIAPVVDDDIAKGLMTALKKLGVTFNLSCKVTRIEGSTLVFTDPDGKEQQVTGTYILNSTGRSPVLKGVGLEECGVVFDRRGIKTDEFGKTNVPGIWACGDVTGRCLLAHAATREGVVAVNNMFGKPDRMRYCAIPSVVYTHPEVAQVGATEAELKEKGVAYRKAVMPMAIAGRFIVENAGKTGTVKVLVSEKYGQVLGVHMIGGSCGEFIASAAAMVELELCVEDVHQIVFPHPTCSEALKETIIHA